MAVYDREQHKVVVRVVYDGPALSGKSTNLRRICRSFTTRRRGELIVPEESDGRTLYFDWLQLDSGLVDGYPLRCQLVSAPGQPSLLHRRSYLLSTADVVVFVCDSSRDGIADARHSLAELRRILDERLDVPMVVQANKQDLPGALNEAEIRTVLELEPEVPVAAAAASEAVGVRETLVLAIRAAANQVQQDLLAYGVDALEGGSESAQDLYRAMMVAERVTQAATHDVLEVVWSDEKQAASTPGHDPVPEEPAAPVETEVEPESTHTPLLPHPMVPSGFIWPGTIGRSILHEIAQATPTRRDDLVGRQGPDEGSGRSDAIIYECGDWFLKTSWRRCFADVDAARGALLELARKKVQLGDLLLPRTVLCLRPAPDGQVWLWTVTPLVTTLRTRMSDADLEGETSALGAALGQFAAAVVEALVLARRNMLIDVHPGNFAEVGERLVYIDDDIDHGDSLPLIGHLILQRVHEYEHRPAAVRQYLDTLEQEIERRLSWDDVSLLDLPDALRAAPVRSQGVREARDRLARVADRVLARP